MKCMMSANVRCEVGGDRARRVVGKGFWACLGD